MFEDLIEKAYRLAEAASDLALAEAKMAAEVEYKDSTDYMIAGTHQQRFKENSLLFLSLMSEIRYVEQLAMAHSDYESGGDEEVPDEDESETAPE